MLGELRREKRPPRFSAIGMVMLTRCPKCESYCLVDPWLSNVKCPWCDHSFPTDNLPDFSEDTNTPTYPEGITPASRMTFLSDRDPIPDGEVREVSKIVTYEENLSPHAIPLPNQLVVKGIGIHRYEAYFEGDLFYSWACFYQDMEYGETSFVPFIGNWHPSYFLMDDDQKKYYFYWRSQVRIGKYNPTDIGYLNIYVFELLNFIGTGDPAKSIEELKALGLAYMSDFNYSHRLIVEWIGDLIGVHAGPDAMIQWWLDNLEWLPNLQNHMPSAILNVIFHRGWQTAGTIDQIPFFCWDCLINLKKTPFTEENYTLIIQTFFNILKLVNDLLLAEDGQGILKRYLDLTEITNEKQLFRYALVSREHPKRLMFPKTPDYSIAINFRELIRNLLLLSENLAREKYRKEPRKVEQKVLREKWLKAIRKELGFEEASLSRKTKRIQKNTTMPDNTIEPNVEVQLDTQQIAALYAKSMDMTEKLATYDPDRENWIPVEISPTMKNTDVPLNSLDWVTFWEKLSPAERLVAKHLIQFGQVNELAVAAPLREIGSMAAAVIAELQEKLVEFFDGDYFYPGENGETLMDESILKVIRMQITIE